ncbi:hypothetical protein NIES4102_26400 [Chondrocystis sp. NIES-4102]|nr:hypothetical protein NIES4102_26400 [Chondrocystis sp. NIES-4102]
MKQVFVRIKPYIRWFVLGIVWFFLAKTIKDRFSEVLTLKIDAQGGVVLAVALLITIVAHIWSAWVWTKIVKMFQQPLNTQEGIVIYLTTNLAKYSPGNIWHFYGRIAAITSRGGDKGAAIVSVVLEPLLMAAAALAIGSLAISLNWGIVPDYSNIVPYFKKVAEWVSGGNITLTSFNISLILQIIGNISLVLVLIGIHPRILNKLLHRLSRNKSKGETKEITTIKLTTYPWKPFLGEIGFIIWRGLGFILTFTALQPIVWQQIPQLTSAFAFAWLLGLIVPGAPGGLGVFEFTAYSLLNNSQFPTEIAAVGLYRLISILAEAIAALIGGGLSKTRSQESGVRSQESGVRSQESGDRSS